MPQPLAVTAFMASPGRFELPAPRLGGVCSIQLSYGDIFDFSWSRMERSASQDFDDLIIRRRPLYPTELRGHIQKLFSYTRLRDSNGSIVRRRPLYPTELPVRMLSHYLPASPVSFCPRGRTTRLDARPDQMG